MTTPYGDLTQVYTQLTVPYGQKCESTMALCIAGNMVNPDTGPIGTNNYYSGCTVENPPPSESPRCDANSGKIDIPYSECIQLEKLYNDTNGSGWQNRTNWLSGTTICNNPPIPNGWYGISCTNNQVSYIGLQWNTLS